MSNLPEIKVFAGENSQYIAESIASSLGLELGKKTFTRFSDGEFVTIRRNGERRTRVYRAINLPAQ